MSNSTSQNRQGKIKKKGSFTRDLPLYLLMIPGLLYLIINNYLIIRKMAERIFFRFSQNLDCLV